MKIKSFRVIIALLLVFWMALIFTLSAQTASESKDTSAGFTYRVFSIFYPDFEDKAPEEQQEIIENVSHPVRKAAHFSIYAVLGVLSFLNVCTYARLHTWLKMLLPWTFGTLYAASDEYHQLFVAGRSGELRDICIDSAGVLLGILICTIIYLRVGTKVRKKTLIKQNNEFFERLEEAGGEISRLKKELEEREGELESLNNQVMELRRELAERQSIESASKCQLCNEEPQTEEPPLSEPAEQTVPAEDISEPVAEPDFEPEPQEVCQQPPLQNDICKEPEPHEPSEITSEPEPVRLAIPDSDAVEYGSSVIGRIVISAAQYSNQLTAGGNALYKELVNLILGRTEVAKSEILDIAASESDTETKKHMINSVYEETLEYFGSVMAQI